MSHPYHHALSSAKKYGGKPEDYLPIHNWFDESKAFMADFRHRALRHHAEGIFMCEKIFGVTITNSDGKAIPVRFIGEQHVKEDLQKIPAAVDWLRAIKPEPWMGKAAKLEFEDKPEVKLPHEWHLDLTTAHMTKEDNQLLTDLCQTLRNDAVKPVIVDSYKYGYWVHVPEADNMAEYAKDAAGAGFSEAFVNLLKLACVRGYSVIRFDRDGQYAEGIPSFDW